MIQVNIMFRSTDEIQGFVRIADHFSDDLDLKYGSYMVDGKSILGILSLGTHRPLELLIHSDECAEFLDQIKDYTQE